LGCLLTVSAQAISTAQEQVTYFLGEVKMSSPTGQPYGSSISLVKRTLIPAENKIVELVATVDAKEPTKEYTTIFNVKGSKFTVKDEEGTFAGEGEMIGKAWEWTGWKYSVNLLGQRKGLLKAEDTLTSNGLTVRKSFSSPDGQVRVVFAEDLKPISREMYELLRTKLLPTQTS
ncbi:MAG TPA: hypothetical protein VF596_10435, partial [Pyrinomonadaceae bacterium]